MHGPRQQICPCLLLLQCSRSTTAWVYLAHVQDGSVACASAQVAIQALLKYRCCRLLAMLMALLQRSMACDNHARSAEPTLGGAELCKPLCTAVHGRFRSGCQDKHQHSHGHATSIDMLGARNTSSQALTCTQRPAPGRRGRTMHSSNIIEQGSLWGVGGCTRRCSHSPLCS